MRRNRACTQMLLINDHIVILQASICYVIMTTICCGDAISLGPALGRLGRRMKGGVMAPLHWLVVVTLRNTRAV